NDLNPQPSVWTYTVLPGTFANPTALTINDNSAATPYPSTINVSGLSGNIAKVTAKLSGFTHTFPDDADVLLVGPAGQKLVLMSDAGGGMDAAGLNSTFDDSAAGGLPDETTLSSGTFKPTDFQTGDTYPAPAPSGAPSGTTLSVYNGTSPNGSWSLYVNDDT